MLQPFARKGTSPLKGIFSLSVLGAALLCGCAQSTDSDTINPAHIDRKGEVSNASAWVTDTSSNGHRSRHHGAAAAPVATHAGSSAANEFSANRLLDVLLGEAARTGDENTLGDYQIKNALAERGYETLQAIRRRLASDIPLSPLSDDNTWERSEEQLVLEVLVGLDLPELDDVALDWLLRDPSPRAVAELGRFLGQHAPGVHDVEIRMAAERSLLGTPSLSDVPGELFQLLGEYGDAGTVNLLADMPWHRDAYASVALALIPDGSGIELLLQDASRFAQGPLTTHGRLAIELLAQRAYRDQEAARALLELVGQGRIPADVWPNLLAAASGQQVISLVRPVSGLQTIHTIFRPEGNQVLYRVFNNDPLPDGDGVEEFRLAMLEALLHFAPTLSGTTADGPGG